jgi:hypothetical protein
MLLINLSIKDLRYSTKRHSFIIKHTINSPIVEAHEVVRDGFLKVYAVEAAILVFHSETDALVGIVYCYRKSVLNRLTTHKRAYCCRGEDIACYVVTVSAPAIVGGAVLSTTMGMGKTSPFVIAMTIY